MTNYKVVYEISKRVKKITIPATSPMEAFKKFKEMMPKIIYDNLSVHYIEEQTLKPETIIENKCYASVFIVKQTI